MARRRYLVTYDIRDDKRLRTVATCMEGYGDRIQYSVFVCDLSARELVALRNDLENRMNQAVDSIMVVDLGRTDHHAAFLFLGKRTPLPASSALVI